MLLLMVPTTLVEAEYMPDNPNENNEGWMLVTKQRPRKQRHIQPPSLRQRKSHARNKKPRRPKGMKKPVDLLEQEPLVPITLK